MAAFSDSRDAALLRKSSPGLLGAAVAGESELWLYVSTTGIESGPEVRQVFRRCYGVNPKRVSFTEGLRWPATGWCQISAELTRSASAADPYVYEPPADGLEANIAEIWSAVLGVTQPGVLDDFWESGGDSLGIVELTEQLLEGFGVNLDFADISANLTIRKLSSLVTSGAQHS